ncbi:MAG: NUDIX hydrolase [Gaiellales bacterium]
MRPEPRIRVSALLRWRDAILLCRHVKGGREHWLLPGGGVEGGETLVEALRRELREETQIGARGEEIPLEGPVAIVESISPNGAARGRHVVHIVFAAELDGSLTWVTSEDGAVRGHRLFRVDELADVVLHPPIHRFLGLWQPGDPCVYLGSLWVD